MKVLELLVLAVTVETVYSGKNPNLIGEFNSKDGATCNLLKLDMGENTHALVMECSCFDSGGQKRTYACSYFYKGDFEKCIDEEKVYRETETGLAGLFVCCY